METGQPPDVAMDEGRRGARRDRGPGRGRGEAGYVLALTALLVFPLMAFTGFAVDLGFWTARAGDMQAVADSAALSGVTYMPDLTAATAQARAVAAKNGYVHGTDDITVTVTTPGENRLKVVIDDGDVEQFFTSLFTDTVSIKRSAVSEYILPVAMGSPRNFLGTGSDPANVLPNAYHENFWLAVSGPCASREQGDFLSPISDQNYYWSSGGSYATNPGASGGDTSWNRCTGSDAEGTTLDMTDGTQGDSYDPFGYFYAVEVPAGLAGSTVYVDAYDASHCDSSSAPADSNTGESFRTRYQLLAPDLTPYDPTDNPPVAGQLVQLDTESSCGTWANQWHRLFTITGAQQGSYYLQVRTIRTDTGQGQEGSNSFSLRASASSTWSSGTSPCSSTTADPNGVPYSANCPQVYAVDWMGVYANSAGSFPSFFLAELGPEHSGKEMLVRLWDPGEGAARLEILDPLGHSVSFDWEVQDLTGGEVAPTGGWSGSVSQVGGVPCVLAAPNCQELDIVGNLGPGGSYYGWNPQPGPYRGSRSKYSDRLLELRIQLPDDIAAAYGGNVWWRIRYHTAPSGLGITDRTSWSVHVLGDPVRLIE